MRRKIFLKAASYICAISLSVSAFSHTAVYAEETTVGNEVIESVTQTADDTETTKGTETVTETETVSETETVNEEPQKDPDKPVKKKKISLIGNTVNRAVYVKRNAKSYDRYLNRIGTLKKGVRYFEVKRLKNGYSQLKVDGKALYVKTSYLTYKCNAKKFVSTSDKLYSYEDMVEDIEKLQNAYGSILTAEAVKKTADKRKIYCIVLGNPNAKNTVYVETSVHAREWKNTQLIMKMIEDICRKYDSSSYDNKKLTKIFKRTKLVIVPMLNPDGVTISQFGADAIRSEKLRNKVISIANGNYSEWKANARGVDINRNYAEGFGHESAKKAASKGYAGKKPLSEAESKAQVELVEKYNPNAVICYHQAGEVIYFRDYSKLLSMAYGYTQYTLIREDGEEFGTFGDFLDRRGIINCTLETGIFPAPVEHWQFNRMYAKNKYVLMAAAKLYN